MEAGAEETAGFVKTGYAAAVAVAATAAAA